MTSMRMPRSTALSWATPTWPGGEVAQAAVHELGGPARRAEGEVVLVDREHRQAAGDRVERDAGAGDAEADHDDVDLGRDVGRGRG